MNNTSYGVCPNCQHNVFSVPVQFAGTATVANGQLNVTDYAFEGNSTPKINTDELTCAKCKTTFPVESVLAIEVCEMCNTHYYQKDMHTAVGTDNLEHRVCSNCLAKITPPQVQAPQPPISPQIQDLSKMTPEELMAYTMRLQAQLTGANNGAQDVQFAQYNTMQPITQNTPINTVTPQQSPQINPIAPQSRPQVNPPEPFQNAAPPQTVNPNIEFTNINQPVNNTVENTAANEVGATANGSEIPEISASNAPNYASATQGNEIPALVENVNNVIDPTAYPFQPAGAVDMQSNGGQVIE